MKRFSKEVFIGIRKRECRRASGHSAKTLFRAWQPNVPTKEWLPLSRTLSSIFRGCHCLYEYMFSDVPVFFVVKFFAYFVLKKKFNTGGNEVLLHHDQGRWLRNFSFCLTKRCHNFDIYPFRWQGIMQNLRLHLRAALSSHIDHEKASLAGTKTVYWRHSSRFLLPRRLLNAPTQ